MNTNEIFPKSTRTRPTIVIGEGELQRLPSANKPASGSEILPRMIDIADKILAIREIKEKSEAQIKQMIELRNYLEQEAKSYVMKQDSHTREMIEKGRIVDGLLDKILRSLAMPGVSPDTQKLMMEAFDKALRDVVMSRPSEAKLGHE